MDFIVYKLFFNKGLLEKRENWAADDVLKKVSLKNYVNLHAYLREKSQIEQKIWNEKWSSFPLQIPSFGVYY